MKNCPSIRLLLLVLTSFLLMRPAVWAANESAITFKNQTDITVEATANGGGVNGGGILTPGQAVSEGLPVNGQQTIAVSVYSNYQTIAFCSASVDTSMPVLASITGASGAYSCTVQNDNLAAVLNTNMENYASQTVTITQNLRQGLLPLKPSSVQVASGALTVISTNLRSTSPVSVNDQVFGTDGALLASCSGKISFNNNSFYTTIRVVSDVSQPTGVSCSIW